MVYNLKLAGVALANVLSKTIDEPTIYKREPEFTKGGNLIHLVQREAFECWSKFEKRGVIVR